MQSPPALPAVVSHQELGPLGKNLSEHNGESRRVCLVPVFPGWLFKEYLEPVTLPEVRRLDRLIQLRTSMDSAESALAAGHASWPGCRVVDSGRRTVGVLMPLAPDSFHYDWEVRPGRVRRQPLVIDVLALPEGRQAQLQLPPQSVADRVEVCASVARVGALFERHGLVYLDWSYANVFWSALDHAAYVIDMDGCSFGPRPQIQSPNWDDPLVPMGENAGNESDRYRLALLIGRCLTGQRGTAVEVRQALNGSLRRHSIKVERVVEMLIQALSAQNVTDRPSLLKISAALAAADTGIVSPTAPPGHVKTWRPITSKPASSAPPPPVARVTPTAPQVTSSAPKVTPYVPPRPPTRPARTGAVVLFIVAVIFLIVILSLSF